MRSQELMPQTCLYLCGFALGGKVPDETGGSIPGTLQKTGEDGRIDRQWFTHFVGVRSIRFEAMHVQTRRTCNKAISSHRLVIFCNSTIPGAALPVSKLSPI